jgi:hypothetical protein
MSAKLGDQDSRQALWISDHLMDETSLAERAAAHGVLRPDRFICPSPRPIGYVLCEAVPRLPAGISELFAHPALDGEELRRRDAGNETFAEIARSYNVSAATVSRLAS